jgi:cytochrome P450
MGLAGFSHDFGALSSRPSDVSTAFDAIFASPLGLLDGVVFFTQVVFPPITSLPTKRQRAVNRLHDACGVLAKQIIEKSRTEEKGERSIMGLMGELHIMIMFPHTCNDLTGMLVQAEEATSGVTLSEEEVTSQVRTLILAGYETTSGELSFYLLTGCPSILTQPTSNPVMDFHRTLPKSQPPEARPR